MNKEHELALCEPSIHYWCRRYWIPGYDFEDLRQESRLHLWKKLDKFDPEQGTVITWAKPVIINHLRDLLKQENRKKRSNGLPVVSLPDYLESIADDLDYLIDFCEENNIRLEDIL